MPRRRGSLSRHTRPLGQVYPEPPDFLPLPSRGSRGGAVFGEVPSPLPCSQTDSDVTWARWASPGCRPAVWGPGLCADSSHTRGLKGHPGPGKPAVPLVPGLKAWPGCPVPDASSPGTGCHHCGQVRYLCLRHVPGWGLGGEQGTGRRECPVGPSALGQLDVKPWPAPPKGGGPRSRSVGPR